MQMPERINGYSDWMRHMKYKAIEAGYLEVFRKNHCNRVVRSLRITDLGMRYLAKYDFNALQLVQSRPNYKEISRSDMSKMVRQHALAIGLVIAKNIGATIWPNLRPSILDENGCLDDINPNMDMIYYYPIWEFREAIKELSKDAIAKTSRMVGVIVHGNTYLCLYYFGTKRCYYRPGQEDNIIAMVGEILRRRGFECSKSIQVIVGSSMRNMPHIVRGREDPRSKLFVVPNYRDCFYIENSKEGDAILAVLADAERKAKLDKWYLKDYLPPDEYATGYDGITKDGMRPVILAYTCNLRVLRYIDFYNASCAEGPLILCYDYQQDAIVQLVGPLYEVRVIERDAS